MAIGPMYMNGPIGLNFGHPNLLGPINDADHLSRLENPDLGTFTEDEIADEFPDEHLMVLKTELNNDEPCASVTGRKVYESGFFWPTIFKDAKDYMMICDACQRSGNISSKMAVDYVSKRVEAQALPTNDARVVIKFLRRLFARFGVPKALIRPWKQRNIDKYWWRIYKSRDLKVLES
ncbi:reverse transcriptase domain-containing protein [Tanacetum coccineum]